MPCSDLLLHLSIEQGTIISEFEINGNYEKLIIGGKERENPWRDDIYNWLLWPFVYLWFFMTHQKYVNLYNENFTWLKKIEI